MIGLIKKLINLIVLFFIAYRLGCKILSINVSYKCLKGKNINVQPFTQIDASSSIGSNTYIGRLCTVSASVIGKYVSIANNVSIGQGEHLLNKISTSSLFYQNPWSTLTRAECVIENDVWIGTDAIILRGVKVSTGAVIGANSVVTKDVPPYAVVVGSPARIIRYRFSKQKIHEILNSKWWEKDPAEAALIHSYIEDKCKKYEDS